MRGRGRLVAAALLAASCGGEEAATGGGSDAGGSPWFVESAAQRGVDFAHVIGFEQRFWFPEIVGSGAALFDMDGDGDLDLYCVQGGDMAATGDELPSNRLFRNEGGGRFVDVTDAAGVGDRSYGMGCATGDVDGDGDIDLYVTNLGPNVLYRNEGDGTFTDVSADAGVDHDGWGLSCGFYDQDRDGDLDLFVSNYLNWNPDLELECRSSYGTRTYCSPNNYEVPARDRFFRNDGSGRFVDATKEVGMDQAYGNGMGVAIGDFDANGWPDVYVGNDGMANQLWLNSGGKYQDKALLAGCAVNMQGVAEASMGVAMVDVDQDGDSDLHMTHLNDESNTFYLNRNGMFTDRTPGTGLGRATMHMTGFGLGFADFDCDGALDVYVANGRVEDFRPYEDSERIFAEPNQVFRGLGGAKFEEVLPKAGVASDRFEASRGAAFGDIDDDGDIDIVVIERHAKISVFENVARGDNHWLQLRVLDENGLDAITARVAITVGESTQYRTVQTCYSYCSANDPRVHFGLGDATRVDEIAIRWPDGTEESFGSVDGDRRWVLRRGAGSAVEE